MKYIGVTIGPIYKTMKESKKTRELWASSYIFSYILRQIANKFERNFILPKKDNSITDIGVFNDRFIFESKEDDLEKLEKTIDEVLKDFSNKNNIDYQFLKEYLQIHYVEVEVNDLEKENIVQKVYKYLDSKELFFNTTQKNGLKQFFEKIHKSEMMNFAFKEDKRFPTLLDISMAELIKNNIFTKEELKSIRNFEDDAIDLETIFSQKKIPNYYKYIAIVKADGDNMGVVNKLLKTKQDYIDLSNDLFEFIKEANEKIKTFQGKVILGSGDDLFFIAPIKYKDKNIFNLVFELKQLYAQKMEKWNNKLKSQNKQTSLSIGISITYYKYPLFEAFEISNETLMEAKKLKNSVAFNVIKHAGQNFFGIIPNSIEENVKKLIKTDFNFFSSVIYKLDMNKHMLNYLGKNQRDFLPFFENNFNENFDESLFTELSEFLTILYTDETIKKIEYDKIFLLYSILRLNHFIRDKNEKVN